MFGIYVNNTVRDCQTVGAAAFERCVSHSTLVKAHSYEGHLCKLSFSEVTRDELAVSKRYILDETIPELTSYERY